MLREKIFQLAFRMVKTPFKLARVFYYQNLYLRNLRNVKFDIRTAQPFLYGEGTINAILRTDKEVEESLERLKRLNLKLHTDRFKNWDCYRAFSFIVSRGSAKSRVLDVGSAYHGVILPWLERYGFSGLYGCDLVFEKDFQRGKIKYVKQDLTKTSFPDGSFDFITSVSVVEHGIDVNAYFQEMGRLLKPGGYLLTSTDYWPSAVDTKGLYPFGGDFGEAKIFTRADIEGLVKKARNYGLELVQPIDFTYKDKVVYWKDIDRSFTFIFFVLKKL